MDDCTVIVFSCDKYSDTWEPFFKLFARFWKTCPYNVCLSTESLNLQSEYCEVQVLHTGKGEWSKRAMCALRQIDTEYVLVLLDDFFFFSDVDQKRLDECIVWMKNNQDVANFSFAPTLWPDIQDHRFPGFELRPELAPCRVNLQAGLWKTSILLKLLRAHENAWQFEDFGTSRANRHAEWKFYAAEKGKPCIFTYEFGGGLHQGKWTVFTKQLFMENGIAVDYEKRGFDPKPTAEWEKLLPAPVKRKNTTEVIMYKLKRFLLNWRSYI